MGCQVDRIRKKPFSGPSCRGVGWPASLLSECCGCVFSPTGGDTSWPHNPEPPREARNLGPPITAPAELRGAHGRSPPYPSAETRHHRPHEARPATSTWMSLSGRELRRRAPEVSSSGARPRLQAWRQSAAKTSSVRQRATQLGPIIFAMLWAGFGRRDQLESSSSQTLKSRSAD
jgi:hypothetical protein